MRASNIFSRDFILCCLAQFVFNAVFTILAPTLPIYLSRVQTREAEIGLIVGVLSFSSLILRPIVGRALLRSPERLFMITGSLLCAVSSVAYLVAPPFWPLLAVRVFHGIGLALFNTAVFTLVANVSPEMHRGQLTSYFYLSSNIASALGPYFGIVIVNRYDFVVLFLVCTGLSLCSLVIGAKLGRKKILPPRHEPLKIGALLGRKALPPSIIASLLTTTWGALTAFFPLHALQHGVSNPGIFFSSFAVTLILGRALGGKILDTYDRTKVITPCFTGMIFSMAILTFSTTLPMFILAAVILGAGWALLFPTLLIYAIESAGSARGPAMATFTGLTDLGMGVGPIMMGIIIQKTNSYAAMFFALTMIAVINFVYFCCAIRRHGRRFDVANATH
jgi:MFS family permease